MPRSARTLAAAVPAICLLLACCQTPPPLPLPPPPLQLQPGAFAGAPLAGPLPAVAVPAEPAVVLRLRYALFALSAMPREAVPLCQSAQLLAQPDSATTLRSVSALATVVASMSAQPARQLWQQLATAPPTAALALASGSSIAMQGCTTTLRVADADAPLGSDSILIATGNDGALQLVFARDHDRQLELLQLPPTATGDAPFLFAWPRALPGHPAAVVAMLLDFEPSPLADNGDAVAQLQQQAETTRQTAAAQSEAPTEQFLRQQRRQQALQALGEAGARRQALLQLAQESGASLVADLALSADDEVLAALATALGDGKELAAASPEQLALQLDRAGYRALLPQLDRGDLDPAMLAVLYAHAGAVGGDSNALHAIVERAGDPAQLRQLLLQENLAFLYEDDPARMVSAFDWLQAQGRAPAGYDPLADRRSRRAALRADREAAAEAGSKR